jgi:hypothetical protein
MPNDQDKFWAEHYGQLVGCKIMHLLGSEAPGDDMFFGFRVKGPALVDGKYVESTRDVFIMQDPGGNGPGFLDIGEPQPVGKRRRHVSTIPKEIIRSIDSMVDHIMQFEADDFDTQLYDGSVRPRQTSEEGVAEWSKKRDEWIEEGHGTESELFQWLALNSKLHVYCEAARILEWLVETQQKGST